MTNYTGLMRPRQRGALMCPDLLTKANNFIWEKERILRHCHKRSDKIKIWYNLNEKLLMYKASPEVIYWSIPKNGKLQSMVKCVFMDLGSSIMQRLGTWQSSVSNCSWALIPTWLFSMGTLCNLFRPHFPRGLNGENASNHM